jgi:predicted acetyltransferase
MYPKDDREIEKVVTTKIEILEGTDMAIFRPFDAEKDKQACYRIWRETGWLEKGKEEQMDVWTSGQGRALVAEVNGEAECLVLSTPATVRHLETDMPLQAVTGVTTSRIARKQGLAGRLLAKLIAEDSAEGAIVSALGMFEQGYYNQLGFGTGGYENHVHFDPAQLNISVKARIPKRLSEEDYAAIHMARLNRLRGHGACNLLPESLSLGELKSIEESFVLGYFDGENGELTHYFLCKAKEEHGPYSVYSMVYQNYDQFLELLALLKNISDQVHSVGLNEPPGIQLQDLLKQPFKHRRITSKSDFEAKVWTGAYWQMRMNDIPACLAHTHLDTKPCQFNLSLTDPIEAYLPEDATWRGTSGEYVVSLGEESSAKRGTDPSLPTLTTTVNAFTRLWLGVRPATGLAVTENLKGSPELLKALDKTLCLPQPKTDWDF